MFAGSMDAGDSGLSMANPIMLNNTITSIEFLKYFLIFLKFGEISIFSNITYIPKIPAIKTNGINIIEY